MSSSDGVVLQGDVHRYGPERPGSSRIRNFGWWSAGTKLDRIVYEAAVEGHFTRSEEEIKYEGMTKAMTFVTWRPADADAEGAVRKAFYYVFSGRDRNYMDSDEIPEGLPTCDARVKGTGARKHSAKIRIYGEPSRDLKSFVKTWNEIEGFTATHSYYRPGDGILLTGAAAKHDGKTVFETTDLAGTNVTTGSPRVFEEEIELIKK
ncbi:hypothetical protein ACGFSI_33260 [Streptomyces virginiae]|uniref:hypothetical protein n=1 Tax=Streptomyces virginiae TaxID=1961 RepID=UPI0037121CD3